MAVMRPACRAIMARIGSMAGPPVGSSSSIP